MSRTQQTRCVVEIERSADSLHAHAVPLDVAIEPGDTVVVHDAPTAIGWDRHLTRECRVTVTRAGRLRRAWTRATGVFALTELYEVGFGPAETGAVQ